MRPKRIAIYVVTAGVIFLVLVLLRVELTTGGPARLYAAKSYTASRLGPGTLEVTYFHGGQVDRRSSELVQLTASDPSVTRMVPRATIGDTLQQGDTLLLLRSTLNEGLLAEARSELKKAG
jgi:hypothetical protein